MLVRCSENYMDRGETQLYDNTQNTDYGFSGESSDVKAESRARVVADAAHRRAG